jgi:hypothetical protein
MLILP